jgi:hypothetical protein
LPPAGHNVSAFFPYIDGFSAKSDGIQKETKGDIICMIINARGFREANDGAKEG